MNKIERFKFRLWNKTRAEMQDEDSVFHNLTATLGLNGKNIYVFNLSNHSDNGGIELKNNEDFILMQSVGLKDKNGNLIFEGDIVKTCINWPAKENRPIEIEEAYNYIVYKDNRFEFGKVNELFFKGDLEYFAAEGGRGRHKPNLNDWYYSIEVVGNIYENPELLENNN